MEEKYQETVPEITNEMRNGNIPPHKRDREMLVKYADRIEAAWKRQTTMYAEAEMDLCLDATKKVGGNAEKLRKALEAMVAFWDIHGGAYSVRVCPVRDNPEEVESERVSVMARGKAALAAPPRNCDRFASKDGAWLAFSHTYFGVTDPGFIDDAFERWLFAPAAQEGGDK